MRVPGRPGPPVAEQVTRIRPPGRWVDLQVRELVAFRELAYRLVRRDLTLRYRQTLLGVAWVVLQPLVAAGAFTVIFSRVAGLPSPEGVPYFVLAFWGSAAFTAFSAGLLRSSASLVVNAALVSKVYFPRLLLPLSTLGSNSLDALVATALGLALTVGAGVRPGWALLLLPVWLLVLQLLGLGVGLVFAPLTVKYRDVGYVLPLLAQTLLFLSPVGYTLATVPQDLRAAYLLNPLVPLLEGVRWSAVDGPAPPGGSVALALLLVLAALALGAATFRRQERDFADVI